MTNCPSSSTLSRCRPPTTSRASTVPTCTRCTSACPWSSAAAGGARGLWRQRDLDALVARDDPDPKIDRSWIEGRHRRVVGPRLDTRWERDLEQRAVRHADEKRDLGA